MKLIVSAGALPLPTNNKMIKSFVMDITLIVNSKKVPETTNNVYTVKLMYWALFMRFHVQCNATRPSVCTIYMFSVPSK